MTTPTIPNTFTSQTTGLNTTVNSNFSAIFDAVGDGTRNISIGSLATASTVSFSGSAVFNASATFANDVRFCSTSADTLTFYGSLLTTSSPGETLGTSALPWNKTYVGNSFPISQSTGSNYVSVTANASAATNALYYKNMATAWGYIGSQATILTAANVSTVSKLATGRYQVNFLKTITTGYLVLASAEDLTGVYAEGKVQQPVTNGVQIVVGAGATDYRFHFVSFGGY